MVTKVKNSSIHHIDLILTKNIPKEKITANDIYGYIFQINFTTYKIDPFRSKYLHIHHRGVLQ